MQSAFALSLNKVQGQTLEMVGIDLTDPAFAHGQNYVGASRVGDPAKLRYYIPSVDSDGAFHTRNVVYTEILQTFGHLTQSSGGRARPPSPAHGGGPAINGGRTGAR